MDKLTPADLHSLEHYARLRPDFRSRVMEHKEHRRVALGPHLTLMFEDRLTIHYQVQEMLRAERIFEPGEIQGELDAYNPLIPDGSNWKATFLIEYPDVDERRAALERLVGVEDRVWVRVGDHGPVFAIADEDLDRTTDTKTSSVHFLRFELSPAMVADLRRGAALAMGVSHPAATTEVTRIPESVRESLIADLV